MPSTGQKRSWKMADHLYCAYVLFRVLDSLHFLEKALLAPNFVLWRESWGGMGLEISSGKATTPAAWLIRPPQVMSEAEYRKGIIIACSQEWNLAVRTTAGSWLHAEIIIRSSDGRRKPHDELILFFNILLIRPSKWLSVISPRTANSRNPAKNKHSFS